MSLTLDERARDASEALRAAAELRPATDPAARTRAPVRVLVTAALLVIVVAAAAVLALRAASPRKGGVTDQPAIDGYEATSTLVLDAKTLDDRTAFRMQYDVGLMRSGTFQDRVVAALGIGDADAARLVAQTRVVLAAQSGMIKITSRQSTAARAERVVNTFGDQLIVSLDDAAKSLYATQVKAVLKHVTNLQNALVPINEQISALQALRRPVPPALESQRSLLVDALNGAQHGYEDSVSVGVATARYHLVEATDAIRLPDRDRGSSNTARRTTLIVVAVIALLLIGYALGLRRHRTKPAT